MIEVHISDGALHSKNNNMCIENIETRCFIKTMPKSDKKSEKAIFSIKVTRSLTLLSTERAS